MRRWRRKWGDWAGFEDAALSVAMGWQTAGKRWRQLSQRMAGKEGEEGRMVGV